LHAKGTETALEHLEFLENHRIKVVCEVLKHSMEDNEGKEPLVSDLLILNLNEVLDKLVLFLLKHHPSLHLYFFMLSFLLLSLFLPLHRIFHHLIP
jgi:hypothetical protein